MRPVIFKRQLAAASATAIALAQTTVGAGLLTLNGTTAVLGVATLDEQRKVGLASVADLSAIHFTISGTDRQGNLISEVLLGPNNNTVSSVLDYKTVTNIAVDAAVGTNVTAGTTTIGASQPIPLDMYANPTDASITVKIAAAAVVNVTIQFTFEDIWNPAFPQDVSAVWYNHPTMTGVAASTTGTLISTVRAIRLLTNSGTDPATLQLNQAGGLGAS